MFYLIMSERSLTWDVNLAVSLLRTRLRSWPFGFVKKDVRERSKSATKSDEYFWMYTSRSCSGASIFFARNN